MAQQSALEAVATAVYGLLNVAGYTSLSGIYNDIPQNPTMPYTLLGNYRELRRDSTFQVPGKNVAFDVHVVVNADTNAGELKGMQIVSKAIELVHDQRPTVTNHGLIRLSYERTESFSELVNGVRFLNHVALFEAWVDQTA